MPAANLILMLLIGLVFGAIAGVAMRGRGSVFAINVALGVIGAGLGAFLPVLLGQSAAVDVSTFDYLLRSLMGSFVLVLLASLFRPVRLKGSD